MAKRVSIVVITYNARDDLKECLVSLANQDYGNREIIVVDDASTDGTKAFLQQYQSETAFPIKVMTSEKNLGVAGSRNVGIRHADGDIIAFTDADCVTDPRWISELVIGYEDPDVAGVGGSIAENRITNIWELLSKGRDFIAPSEGYVPFIKGCNMSFDAKILRKYLFNDEIKYGYEELLLCDRLINDGYKVYYRPQALVHHKHRRNLKSLIKQIYLRGKSSIWYLQKKKNFFMYKRHFILLCALCLIPFCIWNGIFLYPFFLLFFIFAIYLLYEEILFGRKNVYEMIISFPFIVFLELFHFAGSFAGLIHFRILKRVSI